MSEDKDNKKEYQPAIRKIAVNNNSPCLYLPREVFSPLIGNEFEVIIKSKEDKGYIICLTPIIKE